ncbi:MAG TPA: hypothetical protein VGN75_10225 [Kaistia sp.]|jgi:hypothetical protein|nr:hypothetical protein [Kaistia sp.]
MGIISGSDFSDLIEWLDIEAIASRTPDHDRQNFQAAADILRRVMGASPAMWMYRWKINGTFVRWQLTDAADRSELRRLQDYQELPLYGPLTPEPNPHD